MVETLNTALLRRREVERMTGMSRSSIYARMASGNPQHDPAFPVPVQIGGGSVRWVRSEVENWIQSRIAASRSKQAA